MEPYVGVLHQLQSAVLYTLSVRISYVEGGEFFAKWQKLKPMKIEIALNLWLTKILAKEEKNF